MSAERGSGRTTRQMESAPIGSIFVWVNGSLSYPRDLARKLKRLDLVIVRPESLERWAQFMGTLVHGLIKDHACELTDKQLEGYREIRKRVVTAPTPPTERGEG